MLFNSLEFLLFFPIVTAVYFFLPQRFRAWFLLFASCVFYMSFVPAYILILAFTIFVDYFAGMLIEGAEGRQRKYFLVASVFANVGVLALFKYYNFLDWNLDWLLQRFGRHTPLPFLAIALPIGLSFHTFQAMSYTIEVYRRKQRAERNLHIYALYVMFYPQLVAGPIERPQNLLHQFYEHHEFRYSRVTGGLKLMAWGFFKKVVIADRLARMVSRVYDDPWSYQGLPLILATFYFAIQIYCDFSGYSDIAIGAAEVMGFRLMRNFNRPYFARSIADFWGGWHISLSTWFRDYLYICLGGNRVSIPRWYLNLFIVFLVSGLWHGANWTFVAWGALHGFYMLFGLATGDLRRRWVDSWRLLRWPRLYHFFQRLVIFALVTFAWIFFRARNGVEAVYIVGHLFSGVGRKLIGHEQLIDSSVLLGEDRASVAIALGFITLLGIIEAAQGKRSIRGEIAQLPAWSRWGIYYALLFTILWFGVFNKTQFIYFQF